MSKVSEEPVQPKEESGKDPGSTTTSTLSRDATYAPHFITYNLRHQKLDMYGNCWPNAPGVKPVTYHREFSKLEETVLTQYSLKKRLKIFGKRGAIAVLAEIRQLHDMEHLEPKKYLIHTEGA